MIEAAMSINAAPFSERAVTMAGHAGLGVDIVSVRRMADMIARLGERFAERVFTAAEIETAPSVPTARAQHFAARFAAKEAVFKLLGTGTAAPPWRDVEIVRTQAGSPLVKLHRRALDLAVARGLDDLTVSMSHEDEYAIAIAVAANSKGNGE